MKIELISKMAFQIILSVLAIIAIVLILSTYFNSVLPEVDAFSLSDISSVLEILGGLDARSNIAVDMGVTIIKQNELIIEQNFRMIELLEGNKNIFVENITPRYDVLNYNADGTCDYFDRKTMEFLDNYSCP